MLRVSGCSSGFVLHIGLMIKLVRSLGSRRLALAPSAHGVQAARARRLQLYCPYKLSQDKLRGRRAGVAIRLFLTASRPAQTSSVSG